MKIIKFQILTFLLAVFLVVVYYGISAIPMQIQLHKTGKEFYRHYGFIS